jgi:hypothetical protein
MSTDPDKYYEILEVEQNAAQDEIKQAYKDLAKVWHPDRFSDNPRLQKKAEEKLKLINAAYTFLKSYQPQATPNNIGLAREETIEVFVSCENLEKLLERGELKAADHETKRLLLELAGREKDGWLRPEDVKNFSPVALSTIDQLWIKHSDGRFGFSVQRRIWHKLACNSSANTSIQTISENKFGQATRWRSGDMWLSPWDSFTHHLQAPPGSFPRDYIFALSGWWSYSKGWTGYLLWRFDEVFLKLK